MNIEQMMLQVLDEPTECRIIVITCYPDFNNDIDNELTDAYFMIDRGVCHSMIYDEEADKPVEDEEGNPVYDDGEVYDYWLVTDSLGQSRKFNSNRELIDFLESIEKIVEDVYVESF